MTQRSRRETTPSQDVPETWSTVPPQSPTAGEAEPPEAQPPAWPVVQGVQPPAPLDAPMPGDALTTPTDQPAEVEQPAKVRRSRFGGLWVGLIVAAVLLVLLLVFVLQNSQSVQVDYFGWSGHLPLAVAMLLGVAAGALIVSLIGTVRILQLRRQVRKH